MTSSKPIEFTTPVGRLVMGDPFTAQTTDAEGAPLVIKNGPNAGQPRVEYYIGVAIPKTSPGWPELWAKILQAAREGFPTMFDAQGNCNRPDFAYKIIDGDSQQANRAGKKPCDREGFPGHWIMNFSSGFPPKVYSKGGAAQLVQPDELLRGYFVRVHGNVVANGQTRQPGVYLNFDLVERTAFGDVIHAGADPVAAFGDAPAHLPPGASEAPTDNSPPLAGPGATTPPPAAPGPGAMPPAGTPAAPPVQPAAGFSGGPGATTPPPAAAPAPGPGAPPPPAPPVAPPAEPHRRGQDGKIYAESALAAAGWTPEQIATLPVADPNDVPI